MIGPPAESAYPVEPRGVAAIKPSHLNAKSSSPAMETSTEMSWWGRFLIRTASLAARCGPPSTPLTSSILYSWTSSPPPSTFATPVSISSGSIPDMNPTLPRLTPRRTRPGYILEARNIVPSPPRTKTRSRSEVPSGSLSGLTSAISTPPFFRAATSRSKYPSLTFGFATMPTLRIPPGSIRSATVCYLSYARLVEARPLTPDHVERVLSVPRLPPGDGCPGHPDRAESQRREEIRDALDHS